MWTVYIFLPRNRLYAHKKIRMLDKNLLTGLYMGGGVFILKIIFSF